MNRLLLAAALALLLVPAGASAHGSRALRGTVAAKDPAAHTVTLTARTTRVVLGVQGTLDRIQVGRRVSLRNGVLRAQRHGERVLARDVVVLSTVRITPAAARPANEDDEREAEGPIVALSPLTVGTLACDVPAGFMLGSLAVGDVVELTCDRVGDRLVVRSVESEDRANNEVGDDDHGDSSGPGSTGDHGGDDGGDHGGGDD